MKILSTGSTMEVGGKRVDLIDANEATKAPKTVVEIAPMVNDINSLIGVVLARKDAIE